jgi:hypothetical protein
VFDSDYSGESATVYAAAASELVRLLKQSTRETDGLRDAVEVSAVLWNVSLLLENLRDALRRVGVWLDREAAQGRVLADCGPYERHPDKAVGVVSAYVSTVEGALERASTGLSAAQIIAETLSSIGAVAEDDVNRGSTDVDTLAPGPRAGATILQFPLAANRPSP